MIYTPATRLALQIAEEAHRGQTDSAGFPYILHPILVAEQQKIEAAVVAALLHDVCEDCGITLKELLDRGVPKEAVEALKAHGMTVTLTKVIAVGIDDKPGAFSKAVRLLSNEGFDVEYMYAFISRDKGKAYVIIRLDNGQKAAEALHANGFEILSPEAIYGM